MAHRQQHYQRHRQNPKQPQRTTACCVVFLVLIASHFSTTIVITQRIYSSLMMTTIAASAPSNSITVSDRHPSSASDGASIAGPTDSVADEMIQKQFQDHAKYLLQQSESGSKLGDDCHHVFLDVGSNLGVHTRFLMEPQKYKKLSKVAVPFFKQEYGSAKTQRDNRDFCLFAFEPNPIHRQRHLELQDAYNKMGWRYIYMPYGVSNVDGEMTFYKLPDISKESWGYTSMLSVNQTTVRVVGQERIPVIRLSTWINHHIRDRKLPNVTYGNYSYNHISTNTGGNTTTTEHTTNPKVVMKLDIEGMEFKVLPDLIETGAICEIDSIMGEIHYESSKFFPQHNEQTNRTLHSKEEGEQYAKHILLKQIRENTRRIGEDSDGQSGNIATRNDKDAKICPNRQEAANYYDLDDESYLHDRKPYPRQSK